MLLAPSYLAPGVASLVSIPLLLATLGPSEYGLFALVLAIANGVPQATTSWLEATVVRFAHRPSSAWPTAAVAVAVGSSALVGAAIAAALVPSANDVTIACAGLLTATIGAYLISAARLQAALQLFGITLAAMARAVVGAVAAVALAADTHDGAVASLGITLGFGVGLLVMTPYIRTPIRAAATGIRSGSRSTERIEMARYGGGSLLVASSLYVLSVGDRFVVAALRPLRDVGIYAATYGVIDLVLRLLPSIAFVVLRPRLFRAWDAGHKTSVLSTVWLAALGLSSILGIVALMVTALATLAPGVAVDARLAGPIAIGIVAFVAANCFGIVYGAQLRQVRLGTHLAACALMNLSLNILLVPILGPYGASLATAASYSLLLVVNIWGIGDIVAVPRASAAAVGAIVVVAVGVPGLFAGSSVWPVLAVGACIALTVTTALIARDVIRGVPLGPLPGGRRPRDAGG
jgi:O-antigen/teichoic acid export membrane protein